MRISIVYPSLTDITRQALFCSESWCMYYLRLLAGLWTTFAQVSLVASVICLPNSHEIAPWAMSPYALARCPLFPVVGSSLSRPLIWEGDHAPADCSRKPSLLVFCWEPGSRHSCRTRALASLLSVATMYGTIAQGTTGWGLIRPPSLVYCANPEGPGTPTGGHVGTLWTAVWLFGRHFQLSHSTGGTVETRWRVGTPLGHKDPKPGGGELGLIVRYNHVRDPISCEKNFQGLAYSGRRSWLKPFHLNQPTEVVAM